jgi:hypothetical protein
MVRTVGIGQQGHISLDRSAWLFRLDRLAEAVQPGKVSRDRLAGKVSQDRITQNPDRSPWKGHKE